MNWARIEKIFESCDRQEPSSGASDLPLGDYANVLTRYDGVEGFVGPDQYLQLWKSRDIAELNTAYHVDEFAPGLILFGTDGGDTGYGFDLQTNRYVSVPLVGLSREAFCDLGGTFEEFLESLTGN